MAKLIFTAPPPPPEYYHGNVDFKEFLTEGYSMLVFSNNQNQNVLVLKGDALGNSFFLPGFLDGELCRGDFFKGEVTTESKPELTVFWKMESGDLVSTEETFELPDELLSQILEFGLTGQKFFAGDSNEELTKEAEEQDLAELLDLKQVIKFGIDLSHFRDKGFTEAQFHTEQEDTSLDLTKNCSMVLEIFEDEKMNVALFKPEDETSSLNLAIEWDGFCINVYEDKGDDGGSSEESQHAE